MKDIHTSVVEPTFNQVMNQILSQGKITRADERFLLKVMLSNQHLSSLEQAQVRSIFDRLQRGLLKVVD